MFGHSLRHVFSLLALSSPKLIMATGLQEVSGLQKDKNSLLSSG